MKYIPCPKCGRDGEPAIRRGMPIRRCRDCDMSWPVGQPMDNAAAAEMVIDAQKEATP